MEEAVFITQFEELFKLKFKSVVNIEDMGADTDDDGIYHYVDMSLKDVYSFDSNDDVWLEKNLYKDEIFLRLHIS